MAYDDAYDPLEGIAIVGMAGRFPESPNVAALWQNLLARRECIEHFAPEELEPVLHEDAATRSRPNYVRARGVLAGADEFDEEFFGFTPKEAQILDPQQRLFMQAAWEAIENAGYDVQRFDGPVGVFAGATTNSYHLQNLLSRSDVTDPLGPIMVMLGNSNDYVATRVSYKFDLKGPALNLQNACSTSLVAVCTAVQSLQTYQCDMALAGGVSIILPQKRGYLHVEGSILSPDGHCRAFDRDAAGTVVGSGLGVVALRRLRDALDDGDTIYAVIKGAALNNDGSAKVGFTAPSVDGQAEAISMAQMLGGIDPATISYVEAHGTGTQLGDPIEVAGLTQAFRAGGADENGFCAIGSIKSNIGHLDVAAGVAGLIKTALSLHHKILPATINYESPNPKLGIESTPFYVNAAQRDWPEGPTPRRAGVSSFGLGGTNAHVVLEEAPLVEPAACPSRPEQVLVLSARDAEGLERAARNLKDHLEHDTSADLADVAYTLQVGRRLFDHRRSIVCRDRADAIALLTNPHPNRVHEFAGDAESSGVAFMFPGQGSQYADMGRRLHETEPVFAEEVDACARILLPEIGADLRTLLYPGDAEREAAQANLAQTAITQPALFVIEYALAQLWMSWGVKPDAMIGHSVGEYVAACIGGTFTRDDALLLVARRARLMDAMPPGAMLAVRTSANEVAAELTPGVTIAAVNAPNHTVVSGSHEDIAAFEDVLDGKGLAHRRLQTSHAYHSPMMDPALKQFADIVAEIPRRTPVLRWISSLTGLPITDEESVDPQYWARQLREPVQFARGVGELLDTRLALIEVGPGQTLATFARRHDRRLASQLITTSLHPGQEWSADVDYMLAAVGQLWTRNADIDWQRLHGEARRRRLPLPTYPFRRRRHWVDPSPQKDPAPRAAESAAVTPPAVPARDTTVVTGGGSAVLLDRLRTFFLDLSGFDAANVTPDASFLEIGFDSLFLTQAASALEKQFRTKITLRTLLEDAPTLNLLVERILPTLATDAPAEAGPVDLPEHGPTDDTSESRQRHLAAISERYQRKTARSRAAAEANRAHAVDPGSAPDRGTRVTEMAYPIASARSSGAHLTDLDGNDYVDVTNGSGAILFGHNPAFIREAIGEQYDAGIEISAQAPLAGEVSKLVCEMVGTERAAFCSTGSEAVAAAIRIARAVTGRDVVVMFADAGCEVASGATTATTADTVVLEYGTPDALETIRSMTGRLAAVLVEPVPTRHPEFQPRAFLQELRSVTARAGTALIFDEIVTGFRVHPGGARALFGVRADLTVYGDVISGGLPIGVVAGSAKYLDAPDGHRVASGHPLALAAARALLLRLKQEGPELQRGLNLRTTAMAERLRKTVSALGAPVQVHHFSSWFVVSFPRELAVTPLYHALMRERGVYTWEGRPGFLTLAHDDADLDRVVEAFSATLAEMQAADFLPRHAEAPRKGRDASGREAWFVPDPNRPGKYLEVTDANA